MLEQTALGGAVVVVPPGMLVVVVVVVVDIVAQMGEVVVVVVIGFEGSADTSTPTQASTEASTEPASSTVAQPPLASMRRKLARNFAFAAPRQVGSTAVPLTSARQWQRRFAAFCLAAARSFATAQRFAIPAGAAVGVPSAATSATVGSTSAQRCPDAVMGTALRSSPWGGRSS